VSFHLGKPIFVMIVLAAISGLAIAFRPAPNSADLTVWVFADSHARTYRGDGTPGQHTLVDRYKEMTGKTVQVKLINAQAINLRMNAIFDRNTNDGEVPDLCEVEIGSVGRYFRPPLKDVGWLPLNDMLDKSGWRDKIIASRLATWSSRGKIFGIPHAVHPTSLVYRADLFKEANVDLESAKTWPEFQQKCLQFQTYWREHGHPNRRAIEVQTASSDNLIIMMMQQHINPVDDQNKVYINDPRVAKTLAFCVECAVGPDAIGADITPGPSMFMRDLARGDLCVFFMPDWRNGYIKRGCPEVAGKMRMMPLPIFNPGDARTASWGGTMVGIPKMAKDPEASFKLAEFLYLSKEAIAARRKTDDILPPVKAMWNDPEYQEPDPFYGGQRVGALYVELARELPPRLVTPFTSIALATLNRVVHDAMELGKEGHSGIDLEQRCQKLLDEAAEDVHKRIEFGKFEG